MPLLGNSFSLILWVVTWERFLYSTIYFLTWKSLLKRRKRMHLALMCQLKFLWEAAVAAHECRGRAGASPDAQVWTMQLRTEMCLNAGLNCSFCTIFTSVQLQEGYFSYMGWDFWTDWFLQHVVPYLGQRGYTAWEVVQAGGLILGENGGVRNLAWKKETNKQ